MNPIAIKALQDSIKHWEENLAVKHPDDIKLGGEHCACCLAFHTCGNEDNHCPGCPVAEAGHEGCMGSPYFDAVDAAYDWKTLVGSRLSAIKAKKEWQKAAQAEIDFLKSLLPET